jgi:hypothetical protein
LLFLSHCTFYCLIWPPRCLSINLTTLMFCGLELLNYFYIIYCLLWFSQIFGRCKENYLNAQNLFKSLHLCLIILFWTADNWNTHSISSPFGFSHALLRVHTVHKASLINYWHCKCNSSTKHKPVLDISQQQIKTHIL